MTTRNTYKVAVSILLILAGIMVLSSTFMPWISAKAKSFPVDERKSITGWDCIQNPEIVFMENPFFEWKHEIKWFGGIWSIIVGAGILAGAILFIRGIGVSSSVLEFFGLLGFLIAAFNLLMSYREICPSVPVYGIPRVGFGLWIMAIFCLVAAVLGFVIRRVEFSNGKQSEKDTKSEPSSRLPH